MEIDKTTLFIVLLWGWNLSQQAGTRVLCVAIPLSPPNTGYSSNWLGSTHDMRGTVASPCYFIYCCILGNMFWTATIVSPYICMLILMECLILGAEAECVVQWDVLVIMPTVCTLVCKRCIQLPYWSVKTLVLQGTSKLVQMCNSVTKVFFGCLVCTFYSF